MKTPLTTRLLILCAAFLIGLALAFWRFPTADDCFKSVADCHIKNAVSADFFAAVNQILPRSQFSTNSYYFRGDQLLFSERDPSVVRSEYSQIWSSPIRWKYVGQWAEILAVFLLPIFLLGGLLRWITSKELTEISERGNSIVPLEELKKLVAEVDYQAKHLSPSPLEKANRLTIGGCPIPFKNEPYGVLAAGLPGSGKSQLFTNFLITTRKRRGKTLVIDPQGEFARKFYRPGKDHLITPSPSSPTKWGILAEIKARRGQQLQIEVRELVQALMPDREKYSEWVEYARRFIRFTIAQLIERGGYSFYELNQKITRVSVDELREFFSGTDAQTLFDKDVVKFTTSFRAIAQEFIENYSYYSEGHFSFKNWVLDDSDDSWTFITYRGVSEAKALATPMAAFISLCLSTLTGASTQLSRRVYFAIDELPNLAQISFFAESMANFRKNGGCMIAAIQSPSQLEEVYGKKAKTILDLFQTKVVLRAGSAGAEEMAGIFGKHDVLNFDSHISAKTGKVIESVHRRERHVVLASQLSQLPDLHGYLALPALPPAKFQLSPISLKDQPGFDYQEFIKEPPKVITAEINLDFLDDLIGGVEQVA